MIDINTILNGSSKKKKKMATDIIGLSKMGSNSDKMLVFFKNKKIKSTYKKSFVGQYNPFVGDKKTKSQSSFLKRSKGSTKKRFNDKDKDGVINGLDCAMNNKNKHGIYYRGINDTQLKSLQTEGMIEPKFKKGNKPKRVWITKQKDVAERYGSNIVEMEIDDNRIKIDPGRSRMVYTEDEILPGQIRSIKKNIKRDGDNDDDR